MFEFSKKKKSSILGLDLLLWAYVIFTCVLIFIVANFSVNSSTYRAILDYMDEELFTNRASLRATSVNSIFKEKWANFKYMIDAQQNAKRVYDNEGLNAKVDKQLANALIKMCSDIHVDGVFLIFNNESTQNMQGFIFDDSNPFAKPISNEDLMLEIGDSNLARELNMDLSANWRPTINLQEHSLIEQNFNYIKSEVGKKRIDYTSIGRWNEFELGNNKHTSISYSIPLVDEKTNTLYGVMGIIIKTETIIDYILESGYGYNAYAIARQISATDVTNPKLSKIVDEREKDNFLFFENIFSSPLTENVIHGNEIAIKVPDYKTNIRDVVLVDESKPSIKARLSHIKTSTELDAKGQKWYLIDFIPDKDLYSTRLRIGNQLNYLLFILIALILSSFVLVNLFVKKRFKSLISSIDANDENAEAYLQNTGFSIYEFDNIYNKVSQIKEENDIRNKVIEVISQNVNTKTAVVLIDKNNGFVKLVGATYGLLKLTPHTNGRIKISIEEFDEKYREFEEVSHVVCSDTPGPNKIKQTFKTPKSFYFDTPEESSDDYKFDYKYTTVIHIFEKHGTEIKVIYDESIKFNEIKTIKSARDSDILTGLLNRRAFVNNADAIIRKLYESNAAMIMCDLDRVKTINDTYGHDTGDLYIQSAAVLLQKTSEEIEDELNAKSLVARVSGDEFYMFIYDFSNPQALIDKLNTMNSSFNQTPFITKNDEKMNVSISVGMAWYSDLCDELNMLMKNADSAMYESKKRKDGTITIFGNQEMEKKTTRLDSYFKENTRFKSAGKWFVIYDAIFHVQTGNIYAVDIHVASDLTKYSRRVEEGLQMREHELQKYQNEVIFKGKHVSCTEVPYEVFYDIFEMLNIIKSEFELELNTMVDEKIYKYLNLSIINKYKSESTRNTVPIDNWIWENRDGYLDANTTWGKYKSIYINREYLLKNGVFVRDALEQSVYWRNVWQNAKFIKLNADVVHGIHKDLNMQQAVRALIEMTKSKKIKLIARCISTREELEWIIQNGIDYVHGSYIPAITDRLETIIDSHIDSDVEVCEIGELFREIYEKRGMNE